MTNLDSAQTSRMRLKRDAELVSLCLGSVSQEAFSELCRRYANLVFSICLREIGDRTLAEDAAQGVFILMSQKLKDLKRLQTLSGWLFNASRYVSNNLLRQERRRKLAEEGAMAEKMSEARSENPLWDQIEPHFHQALSNLKPVDREAVLLRFAQAQSFGEVGAQLGVSENTARMRVSRAVEKIRSTLSKAGIAVPSAILAALLIEKSATASPTDLIANLPPLLLSAMPSGSMSPLQQVVNDSARQMAFSKLLIPAIGVTGLLFAGVGGSLYSASLPVRLDFSHGMSKLESFAGKWSGEMQYEDSSSKQLQKYRTDLNIHFDSKSSKLIMESGYPGISQIDKYSIALNRITGSAFVNNIGTYPLNAIGELYLARDGSALFWGKERGTESDLRVTLTLKGNSLNKTEEYRKPGERNFHLRNRFSLKK